MLEVEARVVEVAAVEVAADAGLERADLSCRRRGQRGRRGRRRASRNRRGGGRRGRGGAARRRGAGRARRRGGRRGRRRRRGRGYALVVFAVVAGGAVAAVLRHAAAVFDYAALGVELGAGLRGAAGAELVARVLPDARVARAASVHVAERAAGLAAAGVGRLGRRKEDEERRGGESEHGWSPSVAAACVRPAKCGARLHRQSASCDAPRRSACEQGRPGNEGLRCGR